MRGPGRPPISFGRPLILLDLFDPWPAGHGGWPAGHLQLQILAGHDPCSVYIPAVYLFFPQKPCIRGTTFGGKLDPFSPHFFPPFSPHFGLYTWPPALSQGLENIALSYCMHISLHLSHFLPKTPKSYPIFIPSPSITTTTPFPAAWGAFQHLGGITSQAKKQPRVGLQG